MIVLGLGVGQIAKTAFRFGVSELNYKDLQRNFEYRWSAQNRLGRRPAQQFLGPGEETVTLQGVIYPRDPRFGGHGWSQLKGMRKSGAAGTFFPMASNMGVYHGIWCIKSIGDNQGEFAPSGSPQKVDFTISLTHYGPDQIGLAGGLFGGIGNALSSIEGILSTVKGVSGLLPSGLPLAGLSSLVSNAMGQVNGKMLTGLTSALTSNLASGSLDDVMGQIFDQSSLNVDGMISNLVGGQSGIVDFEETLSTTLSGIQTNITPILQSAIDSGNLAGDLNSILESSMTQMENSISTSLSKSIRSTGFSF